jgi:hypothetical protein
MNPCAFAAARLERDVGEHRLVAVRKRDAIELDRVPEFAGRLRALVALLFGRLVENLKEAFGRCERLLRDRRRLRNLLERREELHHDDHEGHQRARIQRAGEHLFRAYPENDHRDDRAEYFGDGPGEQ